MSDHGVSMALDAAQTRWIELYAGYNAALYANLEEAVAATIDGLGEDADTATGSLTPLSRSSFDLDGLAATRVVLRYRLKSSGKLMIYDSTEALRDVIPQQTEPSHTYAISLTTSPEHYTEDRATLEQVLASWRQAPNEDSPPASP
ncbi:MAG: hypothetical protein K2X80_08875 [Pseudomonadaceae bacterium]|nr:hypothetical protein [Pseudomonadaceae bacterium]